MHPYHTPRNFHVVYPLKSHWKKLQISSEMHLSGPYVGKKAGSYGRGQKLTPPVGPKIRSFIHFLLIFFASFSWRKFCFFAIYLFIFFFCPKIKFFDTYFIVENSDEKSKNATLSKSFWSNFMKISRNFWFSGQDPAEI